MDEGISDDDFERFLRLSELAEPAIDALRSSFPEWRRYSRSQGITQIPEAGSRAPKDIQRRHFVTLLIQETCRSREPAIEFGLQNLRAIERHMK